MNIQLCQMQLINIFENFVPIQKFINHIIIVNYNVKMEPEENDIEIFLLNKCILFL